MNLFHIRHGVIPQLEDVPQQRLCDCLAEFVPWFNSLYPLSRGDSDFRTSRQRVYARLTEKGLLMKYPAATDYLGSPLASSLAQRGRQIARAQDPI